jgi:hypothetical protein
MVFSATCVFHPFMVLQPGGVLFSQIFLLEAGLLGMLPEERWMPILDCPANLTTAVLA